MKINSALLGVFLVSLICGCANNPGGSDTTISTQLISGSSTEPSSTTQEQTSTSTTAADSTTTSTVSGAPSTTTSTKPAEPPPSNLSINRACSQDDECSSGCCASAGEKKKCSDPGLCVIRDLSEKGCYEKGLYWCIDRCQKEACGNCIKRIRCVSVTDNGTVSVRVETAQNVTGQAGSCKYSGSYVTADGTKGYCDEHEGNRIEAKCGSAATADDCLRIYKANVMYMIGQGRSFHSIEGEAYDLYCFRCDAAV